MNRKQKALILSLLLIAGCMSGALTAQARLMGSLSGEAETEKETEAQTEAASQARETEAGTLTGFTLYDEILQSYLTGIYDGWDTADFSERGLCYLAGYVSEESGIGYFLVDLDGDGTQELLVGETDETGGYTGMFYDLYTIDDSGLTLVARSAERDRYYVCTDGTIANEASGGASYSAVTYYSFSDAALTLTERVLYDGDYDSANPWFYITTDTWEDYSTPISEDSASGVMNAYEYLALPYTALTSVSSELGVTQTMSALKQQATADVEAASEEAERISDVIDYGALSQADLNQYSYELYTTWDDVLNVLWGYLKESLPEDEMSALTQEELTWISEKESAVAAAGAEFEGGTAQAYVENMKAAEITKERVYVLLDLIP